MKQKTKLEQLARSGPLLTIEQIATPAQIGAISEAEAIRVMRRAIRPFHVPGATYPRAGVRLRADGRWQVRIWLDPTLPDPSPDTVCDALPAAVEFGGLLAGLGRRAAA
jgi:hypothetical protein